MTEKSDYVFSQEDADKWEPISILGLPVIPSSIFDGAKVTIEFYTLREMQAVGFAERCLLDD